MVVFAEKGGNSETLGRPVIEYHVTLDTAKHLAMASRTPRGREARTPSLRILEQRYTLSRSSLDRHRRLHMRAMGAEACGGDIDLMVPVHAGTIGAQRGIQTVNLRNLWEWLRLSRDYSTWAKAQLESLQLLENEDYISFLLKGETVSGGFRVIEYHVTLDTAKHLAMASRTPRGRDETQYMHQIECVSLDIWQRVCYNYDPVCLNNSAHPYKRVSSQAAHWCQSQCGRFFNVQTSARYAMARNGFPCHVSFHLSHVENAALNAMCERTNYTRSQVMREMIRAIGMNCLEELRFLLPEPVGATESDHA